MTSLSFKTIMEIFSYIIISWLRRSCLKLKFLINSGYSIVKVV
jgi:hypothetical protein